MLTVGSLFSGIGGLDLGLERAGMEVIWQSEIDPYGCRVLKKHWPEVVNHGNIKEINWGDVVRPDIICGGYPCQPFSTAGKRNGTDDPRHLWPWVREAISELRPKYAILENVRGHVSLGLNVVLGEMASIGYDAEWQIVSAASVGAPHRRDRVIIVAYPSEQLKHGRGHLNSKSAFGQRKAIQEPISGSNSPSTNKVFTEQRWLSALLANTTQQFCNGEPDYTRDSARPETVSQSGDSGGAQDVADTHSAPRQQQQERAVCEPNIGGRGWWETEPDVGRVAHGVPSRVDRLKGLGNAVVPQVAELIGRMVIDYDTNL
jgi:DNA (cytosine-5)-methyltransferase 1